jgi:hypothetical protein
MNLIIVDDHQDAVHDGDPKSDTNPISRRHGKIEIGDVERNDAAGDCERNAGERQQAVAQRIEQAIEQHQDENEADRNDDRKCFLGLLQVFELSRPHEPIAVRQFHVLAIRVCAPATAPTEVATTIGR